MSRPVTVAVGPLVAGSATKISTSQKSAGTPIVLNGAAGTATANNICTSQTPSGAGALTLNGTTVTSGVANLGSMLYVYITSAGNDSARTFTISGYGYNASGGPYAITETITGANTSTVSSTKLYQTINSIAISGASAAAVTVGTYGTATLDVARHVILTSGGDDTGITFALTGTSQTGTVISETITGVSGAAASSVQDYLTVTSIVPSGAVATTLTVGTNGVAASPWVRFDDYGANSQTTLAAIVSGTVNYDVQVSMDDPNDYTRGLTPAQVTWIASADTAVVGATATKLSSFAFTPIFARVLLNSGTGTVTTTFRQAYQS